jgi:hypothetical protein
MHHRRYEGVDFQMTIALPAPYRVSGNPLAEAFGIAEGLRRTSAFWSLKTRVILPEIVSESVRKDSTFYVETTFSLEDKPARQARYIPAPPDDSGW